MGVDPLGILFGATGALVVQLVVQLVIVPRVESRKRREDRWEKDVLTLGELFATELPDLEAEAKWAQFGLGNITQLISDNYDEMSEEKRLAVVEPYRQKAKIAHDALRRLTEVRASWLVARITSADPVDGRLLRLSRDSMMLAIMALTSDVLPTTEEGKFNERKFNEEWSALATQRKSIAELAFELSQMQHPPRRAAQFGPRRIKTILRRVWIKIANAPGIRSIMERRAVRAAAHAAKQPAP